MTAQDLKALIERIGAWPDRAQRELARVADEIEADIGDTYEATADELRGIDRGLAAAAAGRFASDDEVEAIFAKHRNA